MYDYLEGRLVEQSPTQLVLAVGGIGYAISIPVGTQLREKGGSVRVWTHFAVRDDAHQLFGFADRATREIFRNLLSVRGVGPGLAIGILSGLAGDALLQAIVDGDLLALTRIKGVGKKTAEQILLDLRDKAPRMRLEAGDAGTIVPRAKAGPSRAVRDAIQALTSIGYTEKQAQRSVESAAQRVDPEDLELLVRAALQE